MRGVLFKGDDNDLSIPLCNVDLRRRYSSWRDSWQSDMISVYHFVMWT